MHILITEKEFYEYRTLQKQLSQLQQENEQLKADYGNIAQVERDILLQQKEELIKHCENEIFSQKESIELLSNKKYADIHIGEINAYKNILLKLKEI